MYCTFFKSIALLCNFPNIDLPISESTIKFIAFNIKSHCGAFVSSLAMLGDINHMFQIAERFLITINLPDSDIIFSGSSNPMHLRMEDNLIDCGSSVILINCFFQVGNIPDVNFLIFSSGGNESSVRRDGNSIDVAFMRFELVPDRVIYVPDFKPAIPANSCEEGLNSDLLTLVNWTKSNLRNPICVIV
jgi:hypothetical protein